ncbi:MAG: YncE family protein, partial [Ignavibacteriales bacterium]
VDDIILSASPGVYEPMHIYLSPDDKYLYVNNRKASTMLIMDTETKQVVKELPIKDHPMQAAISNDGNKIYVVSHHEPYITEITKNGTDWIITKEYQNHDAFHHLYGADLSPDGRYLFVTCSNSEDGYEPPYHIPGKERPSILCIYDTQAGELIKAIDIGSYSTGIAARQNQQ